MTVKRFERSLLHLVINKGLRSMLTSTANSVLRHRQTWKNAYYERMVENDINTIHKVKAYLYSAISFHFTKTFLERFDTCDNVT